MLVFLDQLSDQVQLVVRQSIILCKLNLRLDPELGLSRLPMHVDMHARLLAGEEIETKAAFPEYRRTQRYLPEILTDY
jgi:hypothetical protein